MKFYVAPYTPNEIRKPVDGKILVYTYGETKPTEKAAGNHTKESGTQKTDVANNQPPTNKDV